MTGSNPRKPEVPLIVCSARKMRFSNSASFGDDSSATMSWSMHWRSSSDSTRKSCTIDGSSARLSLTERVLPDTHKSCLRYADAHHSVFGAAQQAIGVQQDQQPVAKFPY